MAAGEGSLDGIEIRELVTAEENEEAFIVQGEVWGFSDADRVPHRLFAVNRMIGGLALGAFFEERMIGFCFAMPGAKPDGRPYLHSHMAGVVPRHQNRRVGRRLKLQQREYGLRMGYQLIEWTFDPLETRNGFFNLERLGVTARRYKPNAYGITTSRLHGSIPTDRLIAEWELAGPRANSLIDAGKPLAKRPLRAIKVPAEAARLRSSHPGRAIEMQARMREEFEEAFAEGLRIIGFRRTEGGGFYELGE